jgi:hypothetical protein
MPGRRRRFNRKLAIASLHFWRAILAIAAAALGTEPVTGRMTCKTVA